MGCLAPRRFFHCRHVHVHAMALDIPHDPEALASVLQACTNLNDLKQVHTHLLISGFDQNLFLGAKLLSTYSMCGSLDKARLVFDKIIFKRNSLLWNEMIRAYARNGPCNEALTLYNQMQAAGIQPDNFTFPLVVKACAGLSALQEGKEIHYHIVRTGFESDIFVGTSLIDMYAKCGCLEAARQVFDKMPTRDVVAWNALIAGFAQKGHAGEALSLFSRMQLAEIKPNSVTVVCVLSACAQLGALQQGRWIHAYIIRSGFESAISVGNSLIALYAKCGNIEIARQLFDKMPTRDVVSWSTMIAGYVQNECASEALALFRRMQLVGVKPDLVTMVNVLPACAHLAALQEGKWIHDCILRSGFEADVAVGTALVDMYAKCGRIELARQLFDKIEVSKRDVVSWNAMIAGYSQNGYADDALMIFYEMQLADVMPDSATMVSVLPACAHLAALQQGKWIHAYILRNGFDSNVLVGNSLIAMYTKCGSIEVARRLFDRMPKRDVVSWSVMIAGYGMHGLGEDALDCFLQMRRAGLEPNHITFVGVLSACSHAGLVDEGWQCFVCMSRDYHIAPKVEHYACMVDLLGRAGCLDKALGFIENMPCKPDAGVWGALLGACRIHCHIEMAKYALEHLLELEPKNAGNYLLLSSMYATAGRWDDVAKVRTVLKDRGFVKNPGCSWIEIKHKFHSFLAGDRSHPQSQKIFAMLESLAGKMKEAGYVPDTSFLLHEGEEAEKEYIICS